MQQALSCPLRVGLVQVPGLDMRACLLGSEGRTAASTVALGTLTHGAVCRLEIGGN